MSERDEVLRELDRQQQCERRRLRRALVKRLLPEAKHMTREEFARYVEAIVESELAWRWSNTA